MSRSAFSVIDGSSRTRSSSGENSTTPAMGRWLVDTMEYISDETSPPPLESPATNSREGSTPPASSASRTSTASSRSAGNGNSGANRMSATKISQPVRRHSQEMNSAYMRGEVPM